MAIRIIKNGEPIKLVTLQGALEFDCGEEVGPELAWVDGTWWHPRDRGLKYVLEHEGRWVTMTTEGNVWVMEHYDITKKTSTGA